ncbi:MAG TPA: glycosyltransferase [Actinomycetota bacterium]|nr:glycosyltransferase [Actinomycetota bacterium]
MTDAGPRDIPAASPGSRVLIVAASMGAGHNRAAAELGRRLAGAGACIRTIDFLGLPGDAAGERLRRTYEVMLRRLPWAYGASMRAWARAPGAMSAIVARRTACFDRPLANELAAFQPDVVVSTYNLASQSVGRVKAAGGGPGKLVTYVTDPGAHPYWIHPHAEAHLAVTERTAEDLARLGARGCTAVAPLVRPGLGAAASRRAAVRHRLGLSPDSRVALVNGGSLAVGSMVRTVDLLRDCRELTVVVLCGHSTWLREQISAWPRVLPLGWTDDIAGLLGAADVLVDNAGGQTCIEAIAAGLPVVLYRTLPGHGRLNAETLSRAGLATHALNEQELREAVFDAEPPPDPFAGARDPAAEVLALAGSAAVAG